MALLPDLEVRRGLPNSSGWWLLGTGCEYNGERPTASRPGRVLCQILGLGVEGVVPARVAGAWERSPHNCYLHWTRFLGDHLSARKMHLALPEVTWGK